jgi:acetyl esterase/lipase
MKGRAPPKEAPPLFIAAGQDDSAVNVGDDEMKTLLPMMSYAVVPNITYRKVNGWEGKLDVMTPRGSKGSNPTLIYYHGGGWRTGSKEERMPLLLPYMAMEWTIVNVEYRLSDLALAPAAVEDALCALRWVYKNANQTWQTSSGTVALNIDLKRLVASGTSAGAHLALMVGMAPASAGLGDNCRAENSGGPNAVGQNSIDELKVAAIVDWFGISDVCDVLGPPNKPSIGGGWIGEKPNREQIAKLVSPITYVRAGVPPTISVHGELDPVVPYGQKRRLHAELDRLGVDHELITIKGGGHGIFTAADQLRAYASIRAFLTRQLARVESPPARR